MKFLRVLFLIALGIVPAVMGMERENIREAVRAYLPQPPLNSFEQELYGLQDEILTHYENPTKPTSAIPFQEGVPFLEQVHQVNQECERAKIFNQELPFAQNSEISFTPTEPRLLRPLPTVNMPGDQERLLRDLGANDSASTVLSITGDASKGTLTIDVVQEGREIYRQSVQGSPQYKGTIDKLEWHHRQETDKSFLGTYKWPIMIGTGVVITTTVLGILVWYAHKKSKEQKQKSHEGL